MVREELHPDMLAYRSEDELVMLYAAKLSSPGLGLPPYAGDCGLDLVTTEDTTLFDGHYANIACGVSVALPPRTFGLILARSSTWLRYGILVVPAVIDEGWRGELFTMCYRPVLHWREDDGKMGRVIPAGTRLSQLLVLPNLAADLVVSRVDKLPASDRGEKGFGSSGK